MPYPVFTALQIRYASVKYNAIGIISHGRSDDSGDDDGKGGKRERRPLLSHGPQGTERGIILATKRESSAIFVAENTETDRRLSPRPRDRPIRLGPLVRSRRSKDPVVVLVFPSTKL